MTKDIKMTRRAAIAAGLAAPVAAATAGVARASAPMMGASIQPFRRVALGGFEVTS